MSSEDTVDVLCLGETMVMLVPDDAAPIGPESLMAIRVGGAESNVAVGLARLGHRACWVSAVGADPFGAIIRSELESAGVDVSGVKPVEDAPTGIYVKDPRGTHTVVHYYRTGSAASRMDVSLVPGLRDRARVVHLSGTTPALSASCLDLTRAIVRDRALGSQTVSFDVNFRPALWSRDTAAPELLALARAADIVFVGLDEAETLWGTTSADEVRDLITGPDTLVVKDGPVEAVSYSRAGRMVAPALKVDVVEPVGAGDAFAAGWLSSWLNGFSEVQSLRMGHLMASRAVRIIGDCPDAPSSADIDAYVKEPV